MIKCNAPLVRTGHIHSSPHVKSRGKGEDSRILWNFLTLVTTECATPGQYYQLSYTPKHECYTKQSQLVEVYMLLLCRIPRISACLKLGITKIDGFYNDKCVCIVLSVLIYTYTEKSGKSAKGAESNFTFKTSFWFVFSCRHTHLHLVV